MKITKFEKVMANAGHILALFKNAGGPFSMVAVDLSKGMGTVPWAVAGGLAVGVHARPRGTEDFDIVLTGEADLSVARQTLLSSGNFKNVSAHILSHSKTGITIDLVTPEWVKVNPQIMLVAIESASFENIGGVSVPVVSRDALVALKLSRASLQDQADVEAVVKAGGSANLSGFPLTEKQLELYKSIEAGAADGMGHEQPKDE